MVGSLLMTLGTIFAPGAHLKGLLKPLCLLIIWIGVLKFPCVTISWNGHVLFIFKKAVAVLPISAGAHHWMEPPNASDQEIRKTLFCHLN